MKIKLLEKITLGRNWQVYPIIKHYDAGQVIDVIPADNLPNDSKIRFWVNQDGWENDAYGFPVYKDVMFQVM